MKAKQIIAASVAAAMALGLGACGSSNTGSSSEEASTTYTDLVLGEDYTDLEAEISMFSNRTDMDAEDYGGVNFKEYLEEFNKVYPNIKVNITTDTNYADDALTHLQSGDYETIVMIPNIDKADLDTYFMSYGDLETMNKEVNYADTWMYDGQVYGVPSTATTSGIVYNKKVFEEAGITELPTTADELLADLQLIKDNTDAIPLYTNYAASWPLEQWDSLIGTTATGDNTYMNQGLAHDANPFSDPGDGTGAYNVYRVLYDAVANDLTEEDYSTTDWESSKTKLNNGEIACMVLGSWAYPQMEAAGDNAEDVGYMSFPITVDGTQYAASGADYCYGINVNATADEKTAALIFVKWMTEESGFSYNEDGLPVVAGSTDTKLDFGDVTLLVDVAAKEGEEDLLNELNSESELNINAGGSDKTKEIVECASDGSKTFDEIMEEWNEAWTAAQEAAGVEINE